MNYYTIKVDYVDEDSYDINEEYGLIAADNFIEAMTNIENYYGDTLMNCSINYISEDNNFINISEEVYLHLNEHGNLEDI